jgi:hypothetical protein
MEFSKVFAVFGSDFRNESPAFFEDACKQGYVLLALDELALSQAVKSRWPTHLWENGSAEIKFWKRARKPAKVSTRGLKRQRTGSHCTGYVGRCNQDAYPL